MYGKIDMQSKDCGVHSINVMGIYRGTSKRYMPEKKGVEESFCREGIV